LMTSISSSTIISNLAASFTLAFSWYLGLEQITIGKCAGILLCFAGAVLVGFHDSTISGGDGDTHTLGGDIIALLAAVGYGAYTTMIRLKVPTDDHMSMQLLLGYVGLINLVFLSPVLGCLTLLKLGNINLVTSAVIGFIILGGIFDNVCADYLWARAVVLTSPTVATLGMSITIPLALVADALLGNPDAGSAYSLGGAFLVVMGFTFVHVENNTWLDAAKYLCCCCCLGRSEDTI
jgi:solute carrier family 35 protein F5